ncbi:MAG: hypothetical protein NT031_12580, partial [Planctomycetota bacterium]|nr:hypothetical protein [Planctomycetota bacterium]
MKTRKTIRIVLVLAVALAGASAAHAFDIITTPYNGADLLHMVTANNGVASNNYPGYTAGIFTAGAGTVADPAGMSYLIQDGDGGPVKMVDGVFDGDKYFSGGMSNPTSVPMGDLTGAANPTQTSGWKWFDAHFTSAVAITHFVYRTADHAWDRTPDQFQLRGSNDGGTTWDVIYRLDSNGGNGTVLPWGTVGSDTPPNFTAVQFNSGVDFAAP